MSNSELGPLLVSYQSFLFQYAMKLTRNAADSDDLLQETFYKALKNSDKFEKGTNMKGWLYVIMKNTFINGYRKNKKQNTLLDNTSENYFINFGETAKSAVADSKMDGEYVLKQVNSIDSIYLESFMMYYNGFKYEEIAEIQAIPIGTVKSRIFLARKRMKAKLKYHHQDRR